ncbi:unnamed protein product [Absidia cylindrospora]
MSHGCEGSGVPVCQSKCPGIICAGKALPWYDIKKNQFKRRFVHALKFFPSLLFSIDSPDDCPFSCEYHGPPCCPFIGQPTCLPPCETFVPCEVTPCPDDCPNDCFYPNADYCCPHSGQPICRSQLDVGSSQQNKYVKRGEILPSDSMPDETNDISHDSNSPALPDSALDPINDNRNSPICIDMIVPCPPECPNDCEYPAGVPCPLTHPPKCRSTINAGQTGYTDRKNHDSAIEKFSVLADEIVDIVGEEVKVMSQWEQLLAHQYNLLEWIYQQRKSLTSAHHIVPSHKSPITTTTTSTTTTTTIRLPSSKICPMIYVPW